MTKNDFVQNLKFTIEPEDVYWTMDWSNSGNTNFHPPTELVFEHSFALSHLLMNEVIFINSLWNEKECPDHVRKQIGCFVLCSDVFVWGSADAEPIFFSELQDLYDHFLKSYFYGSSVWCCKKRNRMPQKPVYDSIQRDGTFNLDEMNLRPNPTWKTNVPTE